MSICNTIRCFLRSSSIHISKQNVFSETSVRYLYSKEALGIEGFMQQRIRTKNQMSDIQDKFRNKMNEYVEDGSKNIIFTEDLKNMAHIAETDDVNLLTKMIKRFNQQNKELRFGNFIFGPVVMRMFHVLNKPNEALECFRAPELDGFFDQLISYQLLLDLLYENKQYKEVLDTFDLLTGRQIEGKKYPRNIVVLTLAACYKLNTEESLDFALKLWSKLSEVGHVPTRRASTFCAGLALNQNKPGIALEVISQVMNKNYTTVRNIKVVALIQLGRIDDTIPLLKSVLSLDKVHTFSKDVIQILRSAIEKDERSDTTAEVSHIITRLKEEDHISDDSLDELLCSEINFPNHTRQTQNFNESGFNRPKERRRYTNRSGLNDMY